jgi:transmembrane protein TMEM260 (protein O-mannosyltransferase)
MTYKRINNIAGWIVFTLASAVYLLTMEATGSFWDCGEFASSAYKVQIPHPPGAPLFVLIGRLFMAPISNPHKAVLGINTMSALCSGFTILFLFWSITYLAKKIVQKGNEALTREQIFIIMAAGLVGAGCYTFCDSFWYSAVESEVYAMSSFFTAIVFWAILKWENAVTEEQANGINGKFTNADRWLILIFYLMGLSIGVHLLNLLTIPSIVMIYYFKRYKVTNWGIVWAFLVGCVITGLVQKAVIQWTIKYAGDFDIAFVNDFHLPFFYGFAFFFVLLAAVIYLLMRLCNKKDWKLGKLALWSFSFMVFGYSSYFTTLMRSNAAPAVDMYKVDNPVSLVGYLARDQYGDWPILYGQDFTASPLFNDDGSVDFNRQGPIYVKGKNSYEIGGEQKSYQYADSDLHLFPRLWDASNDQGHADYYAKLLNLSKDPTTGRYQKPDMSDNINFFFTYQFNWMYLRYFMWNFAGKQNDIEGIDPANVRDGNWKTGISLWDNLRLGDQSQLPDSLKHNKSNNNLYALPLILGLLGLIYQFMKNKNDGIVVGLLFFFTGLAIGIYLNMPGNQPRERDYAFAGSFYAYAIWVGLGVLYVKDILAKYIKKGVTAGYAAALLCLLAVPVIMGFQEWDDHDRGKKTIARDLAIDYLESCAPNAILITFGDNDTYPLWYAQEVEGIRRDVRIINNSLMGTDWYLNELRNKVNKSDPIDPLWTPEQMLGEKRSEILYNQNANVDPNKYMDLYTMMQDYAGSNDPDKIEIESGDTINTFPTKKITVPVDTNLVRENGTVNGNDSVVSELKFEIPKNDLLKNESAVLNIIAANKWKRPIYFTNKYTDLGFGQYLRQDGLTYRLVPVIGDEVNKNWVYDKMKNKFVFGNCNVPGVYYDEENRRHLLTIRYAFADAASYLAAHGEKDKAKDLLEKCDKGMMLPHVADDMQNFPYGMASRDQQHDYMSMQFLLAAYEAGDSTLAAKVSRSLEKDLEQQLSYYAYLGEMSTQELEQSIIKGLQAKSQQERDALMDNLTPRLAELYEDAERGFQILSNVKQMQQEFQKR